MLEIVSGGFKAAKNLITSQAELTESNINDAVKEIRLSLLEADVDLDVVKSFLGRVKQRALGEVVKLEAKTDKQKLKTSPGDHFVAICHDELEKLMGPVEGAPIVYRRPVTTIMMVGLQGTGKTTTSAKIAFLMKREKRRPLLVAADVYRPAAYEQLRVLGERIGVEVFHKEGLTPPDLCKAAFRYAREKRRGVVIFDTAGRLSIDDELMQELVDIKGNVNPDNIFLVVDSMAGRDAVNTASEFNRRLDLSGFIMTKLDGDARGGAALSIKEITGKPIKFLGVGETVDKLEVFRPEGLASRILGMGDIVGLMKDFESVVDEKKAKRETKKMLAGRFSLDDFLTQMKSLQKLGSMSELMERFPMFGDGGMPEGMQIDDNVFTVFESIIKSMTPDERVQPEIIDVSRGERIARGCGRKPEQVKDLVDRFGMMQNLMKNLSSQPGLLGSLPGIKQLAQMRKMRGMDMKDIFGDMPGGGMPGMAGEDGEMLPPGMSPQMAGMGQPRPRLQMSSQAKAKAKSKRKMQKKSRKKSRRK